MVSGQQLGKHVPAATNTEKIIEILLEMVSFWCGLCRDVITRTIGGMSSAGNCMSTEAVESLLLRAVTQQRLGKTIKH
jgi:hypothetical protein